MISIITVSCNAAPTIRQTLQSVLEQTYSAIEHIVVDGASTDGTVDIARSYEHGLASLVSEKDSGISDAMNKGLMRASGEYVLYLNADDYLSDDRAMERIAPQLDTDIVAGPVIKMNPEGHERIIAPRGFNWWFNLKTGLHHQATLCRRDRLIELGGFNTDYRLEMDYDLFLRAYRARVPLRIIRDPFSVMRSGGVSTRVDPATLENRFLEEKSIQHANCPNAAMRVFYLLYWRLYPSYKLLRARSSMGGPKGRPPA